MKKRESTERKRERKWTGEEANRLDREDSLRASRSERRLRERERDRKRSTRGPEKKRNDEKRRAEYGAARWFGLTARRRW